MCVCACGRARVRGRRAASGDGGPAVDGPSLCVSCAQQARRSKKQRHGPLHMHCQASCRCLRACVCADVFIAALDA